MTTLMLFFLRATDKTDHDVLRKNHRFLWRDEDEADMTWCSFRVSHLCCWLLLCSPLRMFGWHPPPPHPLLFFREKELAKKYYDKLFKEYCIADLSRFKENKVRNTAIAGSKCDSTIPNRWLVKERKCCCLYILCCYEFKPASEWAIASITEW